MSGLGDYTVCQCFEEVFLAHVDVFQK